MELLCEYCNKPFVPKRSDALYCSSACRQLAYVLRKARNNPIPNRFNYPSTQIKLNEDVRDNEEQASTRIIQNNNYLSIQQEHEALNDQEIAVNTDKEETENSFEPEEEAPIAYSSLFIRDLKVLIEKRDNIEYFREDGDMDCHWVNLRYRCLIESLLTLSEMQSINLDDLKEICNAFTDIINSSDFESLPEYYPYTKDIIGLWQNIKNFCLEADETQSLKFKIKRSTRLNMMATRWELSHFVKKESFNQLNFEE